MGQLFAPGSCTAFVRVRRECERAMLLKARRRRQLRSFV
jgi:hypothetical protein